MTDCVTFFTVSNAFSHRRPLPFNVLGLSLWEFLWVKRWPQYLFLSWSLKHTASFPCAHFYYRVTDTGFADLMKGDVERCCRKWVGHDDGEKQGTIHILKVRDILYVVTFTGSLSHSTLLLAVVSRYGVEKVNMSFHLSLTKWLLWSRFTFPRLFHPRFQGVTHSAGTVGRHKVYISLSVFVPL